MNLKLNVHCSRPEPLNIRNSSKAATPSQKNPVLQPPCYAWLPPMSATSSTTGFTASRSQRRRPPRAHEWNQGKVVTFVVTLAATRSVTLAARVAGMSRKSAYALKCRDPRFAEAWNKALNARSAQVEGDKADRADTPPAPPRERDSATSAQHSTPHTQPDRLRRALDVERDLFFARLAGKTEACWAGPRRYPSPRGRR